MIQTECALKIIPTDRPLLWNYLSSLIGMFYKILPMWEDKVDSLGVYIESFQRELLGCNEFIDIVEDDASVMTLISILQYLIDHPDADVSAVKRDVFRCINICKKLRDHYALDPGGVPYERMG